MPPDPDDFGRAEIEPSLGVDTTSTADISHAQTVRGDPLVHGVLPRRAA